MATFTLPAQRPGRYRVTVEGTSVDGAAIKQTATLTVVAGNAGGGAESDTSLYLRGAADAADADPLGLNSEAATADVAGAEKLQDESASLLGVAGLAAILLGGTAVGTASRRRNGF